ncbi:MAG TPA: endonuclease/exonuclease/phosphatase family protein [Chitinophagaceae bacterium]|nr:endonuclease/exonuclease/phosphatase family protein [Chitinophagaceae bacterium]
MFKQLVVLFICAALSKNNVAAPIKLNAFKEYNKARVDTLKVLTYNVHHCNPPGKNLIDVSAIVNVVKQSNASIVALQEIDVNTSRSGKDLDQAEAIAKACGMYFCFGKALDFAGGGYGVAILSKYPISDVQTLLLPKDVDPKAEQRVLLTARLTIGNNKYIRFASTHLDVVNESNREQQVNVIIKKMATDSLPFIIGGDFNATPKSNSIKLLDKAFQRSCTECTPTIPQDTPTDAIDFIAFDKRVAKKIKIVKHFVITETYASDHRPVYAELLIKNL